MRCVFSRGLGVHRMSYSRFFAALAFAFTATVVLVSTGQSIAAQQANEALAVEAAWAAARRTGTSVEMTSRDFFNITPSSGAVRVFADLTETPIPDYSERDCTGRVYGMAAVVRCTQRATPGPRPEGATDELQFVRVFVREGSRWMAAHAHGVWINPSLRPRPMDAAPPAVGPYVPKTPVEKELVAVNSALNEAFASSDSATCDRYSAPEYVRIASTGAVTDRAAAVKAIATPRDRRPSLHDEIRVRVYGDVAVLSFKDTPVSGDGKAGRPVRTTRVFTKTDGDWRQVVAISTPLASATAQ